MNKIIFLLLISISTQAQFLPIIGGVNYDRKIRKVEPAKVPSAGFNGFIIRHDGIESASVDDLIQYLDTYNQGGKIIDIIKEPLGVRTGQAYYIEANSTNVVLKFTTPQSLDNAIYTYLEAVGIHWYGAGANWIVKQPILNEPIIAGAWREPTFRQRNFDGTGGLDFALSIDPTFEYKKNWYNFKRRNRYNGDFRQPAHVGQSWYISNKAQADANLQWFNSNSGRFNGRIKVEDTAAVGAYRDWYARNPNLIDSFITINADPEDGKGGADDPLPPNGFQGLNNWNHSEKWWYFANEIAKNYDSNNAKIQVGALSYGDGPTTTLVPRFPLKKNVYPVLTPYAFQTAYLPKQMIRVWNASVPGNMGIYDYWNITQYSFGLPQFNIYDIPKLLKFWRQQTIDGVMLETTDAQGPTGHMFWIGGQMQFDTTKSFDTLYNKYLTDCFGAAKVPIKRMFDRWSLNYQFNQDVNFTLKDLKDATDSVVLNSPQWKRINDLKAYSHFMKMMAQRVPTRQSSNDSVYQYMYSIHQRMLVQTVAFTGQRYLGGTPAPAPITASQLTEAQVEANFVADLAELPVQYNLSNFVFDYDKVVYTDTMPLDTWKYGVFASAFFKAPFTGSVSVNIGTQGTTQAKIFTEDSVYVNEPVSASNFTFSDNFDGQTWKTKTFTINVVQGQLYTVAATFGFNRIRMETPNIILFSNPHSNDFDNAQYPRKYFYVPLGTTKIAYQDAEPQPTNGNGYLIPPGGTGLIRTPTNAAGIYTVDVPAGKDGQVWEARFGHSSWSFQNIPNIAAYQKFSYTEFN